MVDYINRGAELLSPAEIESMLSAHPAVAEVVAFGRAHPAFGEEPSAAAVLRAGAAATPEDLIGYAAERLVVAKVPVSVHLMSVLPRGQTGKIVRRRIKELAERAATVRGRRRGAVVVTVRACQDFGPRRPSTEWATSRPTRTSSPCHDVGSPAARTSASTAAPSRMRAGSGGAGSR